jgi:hypothetical protein
MGMESPTPSDKLLKLLSPCPDKRIPSHRGHGMNQAVHEQQKSTNGKR